MNIVEDTMRNPKIHSARHLPRFLAQNILLWVREWDDAIWLPAIIKPKRLWSGKQVPSIVISRGMHIHCSPAPKYFISFATIVWWSRTAILYCEDSRGISGWSGTCRLWRKRTRCDSVTLYRHPNGQLPAILMQSNSSYTGRKNPSATSSTILKMYIFLYNFNFNTITALDLI
jgi:hypothetical protein